MINEVFLFIAAEDVEEEAVFEAAMLLDLEGTPVMGADMLLELDVALVVDTGINVLPPVRDAETGWPNSSVEAAGRVMICAAATVTVLTATPSVCAVLVFIHRHEGV